MPNVLQTHGVSEEAHGALLNNERANVCILASEKKSQLHPDTGPLVCLPRLSFSLSLSP